MPKLTENDTLPPLCPRHHIPMTHTTQAWIQSAGITYTTYRCPKRWKVGYSDAICQKYSDGPNRAITAADRAYLKDHMDRLDAGRSWRTQDDTPSPDK